MKITLYTEPMENYYDEVIQEIQENIENKNYAEAMSLLKKELNMPYIPKDVEDKLYALLHDLKFQMSDQTHSYERNIDDILDGLHGTSEQQLIACSQLIKRNLRDYVEDIQDYLKEDPYSDAGALLVESLAEQEIQDEFVWNKDGIKYTFYGDSITPCSKSKGFLKANELLKQWLAKNPDMYEMAKSLLIHDVFLFLPLSYDEEDGESLAYDIVESICQMMGREDLLEVIKNQINFSNEYQS